MPPKHPKKSDDETYRPKSKIPKNILKTILTRGNPVPSKGAEGVLSASRSLDDLTLRAESSRAPSYSADPDLHSGQSSESEPPSNSELPIELNMGEEAATAQQLLAKLTDSLETISLSTRRNDVRTLGELPYFGQQSDPNSKLWVVEKANEFLRIFDSKVGNNNNFDDAGRLTAFSSRLLGSAKTYFQNFQGNTYEEAKKFLLRGFPDCTTYSTVNQKIKNTKRKPGEGLPELAIRCQGYYLEMHRINPKAFPEDSLMSNINELFLSCLPPAVRSVVDMEKDDVFDMVKKVGEYLELHPELKTTQLHIEAEREKDIKRVAQIASNEASKKDTSKPKEAETKKVASLTEGSQNNTSASSNSNANTNNQSTNSSASQDRQNQYPQNYGYNNSRGRGYGGRGRGYRGNYHRGRGNYRGNRGRGRGYHRGGRGFYHNAPTCGFCGRQGHRTEQCWQKQNQQQQQPQQLQQQPQQQQQQAQPRQYQHYPTNPVTCYKCGLANHTANNCLYQRNF